MRKFLLFVSFVPWWFFSCRSGRQPRDDVAMHVGQPAIDAVVPPGKPGGPRLVMQPPFDHARISEDQRRLVFLLQRTRIVADYHHRFPFRSTNANSLTFINELPSERLAEATVLARSRSEE
ncbi:MAG TPA: hypothetical protein VHZ24_15665 [Pirellulales bacterium]|nr:hypothetical protein [Pirellulales bacterium]